MGPSTYMVLKKQEENSWGQGVGGSAILIEGRVPPQLSTTPQVEYSGSQECQDWEPLVTATPDSALPMLFSLQKKYHASLLHLGSYTSSKPSSKHLLCEAFSEHLLGLTAHSHNAL